MVHARRPPRGVVRDMDSSECPTHGEQELSFWNGHYDCTGYYLLFLFNPSEPIKDWSLTILKEKLIKIGAKIVSYGHGVAFQMAEAAIPRQPGDFVADRRTVAEAAARTSMRRPTLMRSQATNRRPAPSRQG